MCTACTGPCLAIFNTSMKAHEMFQSSVGSWDKEAGVLNLTIATGKVMRPLDVTTLKIQVGNALALSGYLARKFFVCVCAEDDGSVHAGVHLAVEA